MLTIHFGSLDQEIYHPPTFFDNQYDDAWMTTPLTKEMILDIDKSEVISAHLVESPVLGPISPKEISGGVKTLILVSKIRNQVFNASRCGDNCAKWLLKIAMDKRL